MFSFCAAVSCNGDVFDGTLLIRLLLLIDPVLWALFCSPAYFFFGSTAAGGLGMDARSIFDTMDSSGIWNVNLCGLLLLLAGVLDVSDDDRWCFLVFFDVASDDFPKKSINDSLFFLLFDILVQISPPFCCSDRLQSTLTLPFYTPCPLWTAKSKYGGLFLPTQEGSAITSSGDRKWTILTRL